MESQRTKYTETFIVPLLVAGINLFFRDDPAFFSLYYIPYLLFPLISSLFGLKFGLLSLAATVVSGSLLFPLGLHVFFPDFSVPIEWEALAVGAVVPFVVTLLLVYLVGSVLSNERKLVARYRGRIRELVKENQSLNQTADALSQVNLELEERVTGQQESITYLYNQIKKLDVLDLGRVLDVLLETVRIFTSADWVSVWGYQGGELRRMAEYGRPEDMPASDTLSVESTIEGWVLRNNTMFSVRMLLQYENLKRMNTEENIITLPISLERRSWGVLRISSMPFLKYNPYSERILQIIIALAEPAILRAQEYENQFRTEEVHDVTGLPLISQLYRILADELEKLAGSGTALSVILLEIINFETLVGEYSEEDVKRLYPILVEELSTLAVSNVSAFHYKNEAQLAIVCPSLDFDGASMFCLEALERVNTTGWTVGGKAIRLEVVIGYSSYGGKESVDELLERAEHLMEIQRM
jgi:GGDEF domain-containing protein